jgi:DNA-binding response OmpR family regulator
MKNVSPKRVRSVLVVDKCPEAREVLCTLLEHRGLSTIEARRAEQAIELANRLRPDLIVLDIDSDHSESQINTNELCAAAGLSDTPIVILGKVSGLRASAPAARFLPKPYHYGHLLRKIEGLLATA